MILSSAIMLAAFLGPDDVPAPFTRAAAQDSFGRTITYYHAFAEPGQPLVVYVQGSGASSIFAERRDSVTLGYGASTLLQSVKGKCAMLVVEKPGVEYLSTTRPPGGTKFRKEHALDRWSKAISAAISDYVKEYSPSKVCVIGHSEGGLSAAYTSNIASQVTHVASVAGGGPSFLHDLLVFARRGGYFKAVEPDVPSQIEYVLDAYKDIKENPEDAERTFFGHAYPRWSSRLSTSVLEQLLKTEAQVYVAQGTADDAINVDGVDVMVAELLAQGKAVTYDRVEGADHSFNVPDKSVNGWRQMFVRILEWFEKN